MDDEPQRSRMARRAAEHALVRVIHHYAGKPEFVLLGGLVPELLCSRSAWRHAGTTDVDVQVNLELASGTVHVARLERALRAAGFAPYREYVWRWVADGQEPRTTIKFELLADIPDVANSNVVVFDDCEHLGAANLRGTGFASRDVELHTLRAPVDGAERIVGVNMTGLAGFLLAKAAAAASRHREKDWYDIAFVLLHNDAGGVEAAARAVQACFPNDLIGRTRTTLRELQANFADEQAQGPRAYALQMRLDHPDMSVVTLQADAVIAVQTFCMLVLDG